VKKFIEFLRVILGIDDPPRPAEDPSRVHVKPIFDDVEKWLRDTERFFE